MSSERFFSIQNLQYLKFWNKLESVQVNKLTFIYVNCWVLYCLTEDKITIHKLLKKEQLELKDILLKNN